MNEEIITVGEPFPRLKSVEVVVHGVLKFECLDGYEGLADIRPLINTNSWYWFLKSKNHFENVKLEDYGHYVFWLNSNNIQIEIPAEELKNISETQAMLHLKMAV